MNRPENLNPPDLASCYPLRTYAVTLDELIGWPKERVIATLGRPNEKRQGRLWRPTTDPSMSIRVDHAGKVMTVHVFGHVPEHIPALTPYQEWIYHNVRGQTWVLYLARTPAMGESSTGPETAGSLELSRRSLWQKLQGFFRGCLSKNAHPEDRVGPQVVVEVYSYPTGSVF